MAGSLQFLPQWHHCPQSARLHLPKQLTPRAARQDYRLGRAPKGPPLGEGRKQCVRQFEDRRGRPTPLFDLQEERRDESQEL